MSLAAYLYQVLQCSNQWLWPSFATLHSHSLPLSTFLFKVFRSSIQSFRTTFSSSIQSLLSACFPETSQVHHQLPTIGPVLMSRCPRHSKMQELQRKRLTTCIKCTQACLISLRLRSDNLWTLCDLLVIGSDQILRLQFRNSMFHPTSLLSFSK